MAESVVEALLEWFESLGYEVRFGADVEPGQLGAIRQNWNEVVLTDRLRTALGRINPFFVNEPLVSGRSRETVLVRHAPQISERTSPPRARDG